jgi:hypothetical protein
MANERGQFLLIDITQVIQLIPREAAGCTFKMYSNRAKKTAERIVMIFLKLIGCR